MNFEYRKKFVTSYCSLLPMMQVLYQWMESYLVQLLALPSSVVPSAVEWNWIYCSVSLEPGSIDIAPQGRLALRVNTQVYTGNCDISFRVERGSTEKRDQEVLTE